MRALRTLTLAFSLSLSLVLLVPAVFSAAQAASTALHANPKSMIYHNFTCKYYNCKACTVRFASPAEAIAKGYRACKVCKG